MIFVVLYKITQQIQPVNIFGTTAVFTKSRFWGQDQGLLCVEAEILASFGDICLSCAAIRNLISSVVCLIPYSCFSRSILSSSFLSKSMFNLLIVYVV